MVNPATTTPPPPQEPWTPPPTATAPTPAPAPGKSRGVLWAIIAVVIIVILIVALLLTGVIPGFKSSSSSSSSGKSYVVTFSESGLPSGTTWSVTLSGSMQSSSTASITFSEKNGTYAFTVGAVSGYAASPASGSVTVNGANVTQAIKFAVGYTVTFTESGLPSGTSWSVTLNGTTLPSTTTSVVFSEFNGTYHYTVGAVTGYTPSPASGNVTVSGAPQSVPIVFSTLPPGEYSVTFTESGLPSGTSWSVTLNGSTTPSTTTTITFTEKNGTYTYSVGAVTGYTATPSGGSVTVNGMAMGVSITFSKSISYAGPAYAITFDQTGLPATDLWEADVLPEMGSTLLFGQTSTGPSTELAIPDGTYFWHVGTSVSGYAAVPSYGNLTVAGHAVTISISFELGYAVNFTEAGLAPGTSWTVTLNGTPSSTLAPGNNTFVVVNGTYPFTVSASGYAASPASGSITVHGAPVLKTITFTALPTYTVTFSESGLASGTMWYVFLNGSYGYSTAPTSIIFHVPNGKYPYIVGAAGYTASPSSGNVTVSSAPASVSITFTVVVTYAVTFTETGLASGVIWSATVGVSFNSSTAPGSINISVPNGVYPFTASATGYTASPASGNVTVASAAVMEHITFTAIPPVPTYTVNFTESGLPLPLWEVSLSSNYPLFSSGFYCTNSTFSATSLNCSVEDGYYTWIASTFTANYTASPMAGGLTVNANMSVSVTFVNSSADYLVEFTEGWYSIFGTGGLPNGSSWSATVGGMKQTTEGTTLFFLETNGTTSAYTITPPSGYVALPSSGNVTGYGNIYQSYLYDEFSPVVSLVFVASDPPGGGAGITMAAAPTNLTLGSVVAVTRES